MFILYFSFVAMSSGLHVCKIKMDEAEPKKKFWTEFLELYMTFPCLWKVHDDFYRDREARSSALKELISKVREIDPFANAKYVTQKINSFRTSFRQAHKRYLQSLKSGADVDYVFEPTLWYYKILLPTVEQTPTYTSKSTLDYSFHDNEDSNEPYSCNIIQRETIHERPNKTKNSKTIEEMLGCDDSEIDLGETDIEKRPNLKKRKKGLEDLISVACNALQQQEQSKEILNRFGTFGKHVGVSLQEMAPKQSIYAEKVISEVLFLGHIGQLSVNTSVGDSV